MIDPLIAKKDLEDMIYEETGGIVQSGPFKGMKMHRELSWGDGALSPMLLGCHEQELHGYIENEIARLSRMKCPEIANVGCGEGYYAVGLARRLPNAKVWAVDRDPRALDITARNCALNEVEKMTFTESAELALQHADLVVMDCEGGEVAYLDFERIPKLREAHIIVEIHQAPNQPSGNILAERWSPTHKVICSYEKGRNPNDFEFLRQWSSIMRWLAVCENRPCQMAWFIITPKDDAP